MEAYQHNEEFIEQNFVRIEAIRTEVERIADISDGRKAIALLHIPGQIVPDTHLLEGEVTPDRVFEVLQRHGNNDFNQAVETANRFNLLTLTKAKFEAHGAWIVALMAIYARNPGPGGTGAQDSVQDRMNTSTFESGRVIQNSFETDTENIDISVTRLDGINDVNSVQILRISQTDEDIRKSISFTYIDNKLLDVSKRVAPMHDELFDELMDIDPLLVTRFTGLLDGNYEDDQDLSRKLLDVYSVYAGTEQAERITSMLQVVGQRARSVKSSQELENAAGSRFPYTLELDELRQVLLDIY